MSSDSTESADVAAAPAEAEMVAEEATPDHPEIQPVVETPVAQFATPPLTPVVVAVEPVVEPAPVAAPAVKMVSLEQACHMLIFDFKDGWLPAIRSRASSMGMNVHRPAPLAEWRKVFVAWGGHGVLK